MFPFNRQQTLHEELIPLLCDRLGVRTYLELGCHENETISKVRERCTSASWHTDGWGIKIHAVDMKEPECRVPGVSYHIMSTRTFCREVAPSHAPYDLVFIDADHSYNSALNDWMAIEPHVADEGLILLHDTNPETVADTVPGLCGDSWRLAEQFRSMSVEALTLPYHPGLTIYRKRKTWGPRQSGS